VLYRDGWYYKKDRTDKVSFVGNGKKGGKAADRPIPLIKPDIERSATGKPHVSNNMDYNETVTGMALTLQDITNPIIHHQGQKKPVVHGVNGAGKGRPTRAAAEVGAREM
jgi:hypothetical protein